MKYFTPDNCPIQAGDILHNIEFNVDCIVLERFLDGEDAKNRLVTVMLQGRPTILRGIDLGFAGHWEYNYRPCIWEDK